MVDFVLNVFSVGLTTLNFCKMLECLKVRPGNDAVIPTVLLLLLKTTVYEGTINGISMLAIDFASVVTAASASK